MPDAIIIGAGPGGLASTAVLRRRGIDALVLDREQQVGSAWRRHYERLHLHTARVTSHLPGYRIPRRYGRWVARRDVVTYLEDYAAHHALATELGVTVTRVDRADDGWTVRTDRGDRRAGIVVVATGYNHTPHVPEWPGRDGYTGELLHASRYRVADAYRGKDVLVVGTGNTGAEIAVDLVEGGAARVRLAVRTVPAFVRRELGGMPNSVVSIGLRHLPPRVADRIIDLVGRASIPDLTAHGLPRPPAGVYSRLLADGAVPIIDVGLIEHLQRGTVTVVPAVVGFDGDKVLLRDAAPIAPEVVVAATGYTAGLAPLVGHLGVLDERGLPAVLGGRPALPGLYFTGFTNPLSGMFRELAIDARRIARDVTRRRRTA